MRRSTLLLLPLALGCSRGLAPIAAESVLREPASMAAVPSEQMNGFALRLAHAAIEKDTRQNELISPLSVTVCLSMLANGADGKTRELVAKTLGAKASDLEMWNEGSQTLMQTLLKDKGVDFAVANSLWTFAETPPRKEYVGLLHAYYGAEAFALPARDDIGLKKINDWTKTNTRGRIPEILDRFSNGSFAVLVNALAFDGQWKQKFDPSNTEPMEFHLLGGKSVSVPTMNERKLESRGYEYEDGAVTLEIPYEGDAYRLLLVLPPEEETPASYLGKLDTAKLEAMSQNLNEGEINVSLPKLKADRSTDLIPVLTKMGAGDLFEPGCDFSRMSADPVAKAAYVSQAAHKAFIEWDEEGTKAAAATAMEVQSAAAGPINAFRVDRPFLYFLIHEPTKTILFIGICNDPSL